MKRASFARRLRLAGLELVDDRTLWLRCRACGRSWSPEILPGARLRRYWFRCATGCNHTGA